MPIHVSLAAVAVGAAVSLFAWVLFGSRSPGRAVPHNLVSGKPVTDLRQAVLNRSATERAVRPAVAALATRVRRITPAGVLEALDHRITLAGRPRAWPLERVLATKLLLGAGAVVATIYLVLGKPGPARVLVGIAMVAVSYLVPDLMLWSRGRERQKLMAKRLPDTLDQLTIAVEAGLSMEGAMARAARNGKGPVAEELARTLQEMQMGVSRSQAFRNLAERTDVSDLRHFVLAVVQAEGYGIPIADVLRVQAAEQRTKRRQRAEEQALKVPVKVVFPLVLCIMPTMFIILVGPAGIKIARTLMGPGGALVGGAGG